MSTLEKYYNYFGKIKVLGLIISGIGVIIMMFAVVADALSRNITGGSILGVYEITQNYLMIVTIFPAIPYLYSTGIMPKMEIFIEKMKDSLKLKVFLFLIFTEIVIYLFVTIYTFDFAYTGLVNDVHFPAGGKMYILYPFYFLIPIAFVLLIIENIFVLIKTFKTKKPGLLFHEIKAEDF